MPRPGEDRSNVGGAAQFNNIGPVPLSAPYAVFLGFYYTHLRGVSGLGKGVRLAVAVAIPFVALRILNADSLQDMRDFLFWAFQVFLYCSLLGLLGDYLLLRRAGFPAWNLRVIHNVPTVSAYTTVLVTGLSTTVVTLVNGRLQDVVTFFLNTVLPQVPKIPNLKP